KNGLPFRGHREKFDYETPNQGLFIELVKLVSKYDAVLAKHLAVSNKNETYLSHMIQNDIIKSMAHETVQLILYEIKLAKYFTIIIDSTIDINKNDQFSLSLRFVDQEGKIREHFICFEELLGASANNYFNILNKCIEKYDLDFSKCRGQAYDGASTMSGRFSGLQSRVKELNPLALYIHCCAHNLNLVLIDSIRSSVVAVSFFGTLETLYTFLTSSLPRLHILKEEQAKQVDGVILSLKKLSDTRWASHKRAVDSVKYFFEKKTNEKSINQLKKLSETYKIDIDQDDLILEYESFTSVYYHLNKDCEDISTNDVLKFIITNDMISSYPNLSTLYKIFYTLPVSSATAERSFSRLKLIKTFLRSTIAEEKLSNLAILSIEKCTSEKINFNRVIETFAEMKKRRKLL
ncbi:zinc finger MYM-type protein 1-like, partial [Myzus persicae]|uniref:zinc finger MYM-type protein 1-like n=1 Tax=Myzus persicae TaxID=13164 RepID=UPI000B9303D3